MTKTRYWLKYNNKSRLEQAHRINGMHINIDSPSHHGVNGPTLVLTYYWISANKFRKLIFVCL